MSDATQKSAMTIEEHLVKTLGYGPRSKLKKAFLEKKIFVNGKAAARTDLYQEGDKVEVRESAVFRKADAQIASGGEKTLLPFCIHNDWVALCKPAGMKPHPLHPEEQDTALNCIHPLHPEVTKPFDPQRPLQGGLIHRLDVGTSGLLFAARTPQAWAKLRETWTTPATEKMYAAWVYGEVKGRGLVDCTIALDEKSSKRMRILKAGSGESAQNTSGQWKTSTAVFPLFSMTLQGERVTLVLVRIFTGVRHQIRVTLSALGHPVLFDPVYGLNPKEKPAPNTTTHAPQINALPADYKTPFEVVSQRIAEQLNIFHDFEIMHTLSPDKLPKNGFFLHAVWAKNPQMAGLEEGLYCPLPDYF